MMAMHSSMRVSGATQITLIGHDFADLRLFGRFALQDHLARIVPLGKDARQSVAIQYQ
jgi:hypothetical protein